MYSVAALPCEILMFNCTPFHTVYAVLAGLICTTSSVEPKTAGIFVRNVLKLIIFVSSCTTNW